MNAETVNGLLGITESFRMPDALKAKLLDPVEKTKLFDSLMAVGESLDHDWFTEYFQTEHGDRDKLKQDYTPDCVCEIAASVTGTDGVVADICSGTGGLTLKAWQLGAREFYCVEFAERAIPVLLTNLAIRNIKATVVHGDALTKETFNAYRLTPGEKYSDIEVLEDTTGVQDVAADRVIMNPPYSMKWSGDRGFFGYETPPKSKSDLAFVLDGLEKLKDGGVLTAVLPHGVLFRGSAEGKIRKKLIENNLFNAIIGLPNNLFLNTGIPVAIVQLKKGKTDDGVLFIDADKECIKEGKQNVMQPEHIKKVLDAYRGRCFVDKFAYVTNFKELEENDFNMNIPRYVDTYVPPPPIDAAAVSKELLDLSCEIVETEKTVLSYLDELVAYEPKLQRELDTVRTNWRKIIEVQTGKADGYSGRQPSEEG